MIATRLTAIALAITVAAPAAQAQSAEAEVLFREAKRLLKKGKIAEACDKLDAADKLESTAGTELNLGDCREKNGQLATAWAAFVKAAATAKHAGDASRGAEARRRADALEPKLVYLTISVPPEARLDGLVITRNDTAVDPAVWGQRVPVDPDTYEIAAAAPGHEGWKTSVVIKAKHKKIEVPVLDAKPLPEAPPSTEAKLPAVADQRDVREPDRHWSGRRTWGVVLGAVGVAAAGAGIAFGVHARSVERDADAICPMTDCGDAHAISLNQSARRDALYANIGYAAGGALVVTGVVLWLTGGAAKPADVAVAPIAGPGLAGLGVRGGF